MSKQTLRPTLWVSFFRSRSSSAVSGDNSCLFLCKTNIEWTMKMQAISIPQEIRRRWLDTLVLAKRPAVSPPTIPPNMPPLPKNPISLFASLGLKTSLTVIQNWVPSTIINMFAHTQKARGTHLQFWKKRNQKRIQVRMKKMKLEISRISLLILTWSLEWKATTKPMIKAVTK